MTRWGRKPLGELTDKIGSGATPRGGKDAYKQQGISLIRSLNVHDLEFRYANLARIDDEQADALANVSVEARDVLLNITGASIARCAQVPRDVLPARVNQHVAILRPKIDVLDSRFLSYLLVASETKEQLLTIGDKAGATRQALTKAQLQSFYIPLPPIEEQRRIVAVLDQAFAALDRAHAHAEANLVDATEVFSRTVERLLERDDIGISTIGEVCEIQSGAGFPHKDQGRKTDQYPFYKVSDMNLPGNEWRLRHANNYIDELTRKRLRAAVMPLDAIVFPKVGGAIATNKKRVIEAAGCVDNNVMGLIPDRDRIDPTYLHEWLYATDIYEFSNKANPPSITQGTVRDWPIPVPSKAVQRQIVEEIRAMRRQTKMLSEAYQNALEDIADLRQSLLQKAFSGQLT